MICPQCPVNVVSVVFHTSTSLNTASMTDHYTCSQGHHWEVTTRLTPLPFKEWWNL